MSRNGRSVWLTHREGEGVIRFDVRKGSKWITVFRVWLALKILSPLLIRRDVGDYPFIPTRGNNGISEGVAVRKDQKNDGETASQPDKSAVKEMG